MNIKEIILKIKESELFSFVARNLTWIILGFIALYWLNPNRALLHNITLIVVLEAMALGLSNVGVFAFTKLKFVQKLVDSDPSRLTAYEAQANAQIIAAIFIGVHILVGLGWYNLQYNEKNIEIKDFNTRLYSDTTYSSDTIYVSK